ncbi:malonyl-ACP O-methyltransferase BioC [Paenibacillus xylanivorans]|uniref:Malonyl-[acyl-carrier protein] O-methyltransferase n=1 Tax=Paenibacillus xylanivorans TaxID=1705561 RepID=A0A0M9BPB8_9BACL|nr:malonyl-ACP O-methyltransferase BioC [Paenibacillus xylanivorans]KOY16069.1 malonyl-CoA O-methyltransferase [Paenibacillus xylanivorans]
MTIGRNSAVQRQFNRRAISYDAHAHIQRSMADHLARSLAGWKGKDFLSNTSILEIGCGTGALTQILVNEWPNANITALDIAPEMIEVASKRFRSAEHSGSRNRATDRLRFLQADIETWATTAPESSMDIIVSSACFQWISSPQETLGHLRRMLRPGGLLIFTTFGPDTFCEMHEAFNEVYRVNGMEPQRHGLSFPSPVQWENMLNQSGYSSFNCERSIHKEKYASVRNFLYTVKGMGASTSEAVTVSGYSLRRLFTDMYREYENRFSMQGGVAATYDLLLIQSLAPY